MSAKTEREKMLAGELYNASDTELADDRRKARILFKKLNEQEKVTIVQVTHSEHNATYGNRIIRLKDGLVVQ